MSHQVNFDFYGITIGIHSQVSPLMQILQSEFAYFLADKGSPQFKIEVFKAAPPLELLPAQSANRITANSLTYDVGKVRWNDFHGQALSRYDYESQQGVIWSDDEDLLHELAYLLILSLTGKALDQRGFHKVHACAIRYGGRDILIMLPSMGGKTTLFLELARYPGVELLSDDTPLISPQGRVLPFPLRLGVEKIPADVLGDFPTFKRRHHSTKYLIPLQKLAAPIAQGSGGSPILVFGQRWSEQAPRIARLSPLRSLRGLFEHMVIGIGLPMVLEYFVQHTPRDWLRLVRIGIGRSKAALGLWQHGESWHIRLSGESAAKAKAILALVKKG